MPSWFAIWLATVPVIIFLAKPQTALWLKSGRIVFLFILFAVMQEAGLSLKPDFDEPPMMYFSTWHFFRHTALFAIWAMLLCNLYVGWCEFIWRCYHKQWSKKLMDNIQYGMVSNISVFLALFMTCTIPMAALYIWIRIQIA